MKKDYIGGGKQETAIKFYIKDLQDEGKGKRAIINKLIKEDEKISEYKNAKHKYIIAFTKGCFNHFFIQ